MFTPANSYTCFPRPSRRLLLICSLLFSATLFAKSPPSFDEYSPDVAQLLKEYHAETDELGSVMPSVLAYKGNSTAETLIDFDRGEIKCNKAQKKVKDM